MKSLYIGDIFVEYDLTNVSNGNKGAVIFLLGLPGTPKVYPIFEIFKSAGYDIFLPRYEGTWESKGIFLDRSPVLGTEDLIKNLQQGLFLEDGVEYKKRDIFIVGASFGGGIALSLSNKVAPNAVCVFSPVISFPKVNNIQTLGAYLSAEQSESYRFDKKQWEKLISDSLYSPVKDLVISPENVLIFAGKNDDQINISDIIQFANAKNILNLNVLDVGHITLSKVSEDMSKIVLNFFNSKK